MFTCHVCRSRESREQLTKDFFQINDKYVLVERIPATGCIRCGEETVSAATTERMPFLVHGQAQPVKSIALDVFEFA